MFSVSSGGRDIAKKTLAPQTKITIVIISGMTSHVISSSRPPWIRPPIASGERRRKRTAYVTINPAISREKNVVNATRKKYSASTRPAIVDAASGKSGVPDHMLRLRAPDSGLQVPGAGL